MNWGRFGPILRSHDRPAVALQGCEERSLAPLKCADEIKTADLVMVGRPAAHSRRQLRPLCKIEPQRSGAQVANE
jgi:hypothetical protein